MQYTNLFIIFNLFFILWSVQLIKYLYMNRKLFLIIFLLSFHFSFSQDYETIWKENFDGYQIPSGIEGESDGNSSTNKFLNMGDYTSSFSKWTIDASNASLQNFSDYAAVFRTTAYLDPHFRVQDTHGSEVTTPEGAYIDWITEDIDISGHTNVSVSMFIQETGDHESNDYIDVSYSTDGGANYTRLQNWNNLGDSDHTLTGDTNYSSSCNSDLDFGSTTVAFKIADSANTLKIKVTFKNGASSENFILDDVNVFGEKSTLSNENNSLTKFTLHPNPTKDNFTIKTSKQIKEVKIYTINGRLVYSKTKVNSNDYSMSTSNFSNGIYLVKIVSEDANESTKKLIIQ